ncbi:unnamed protein product, partial [Closterium sp. NIES-53]
MALLRVLAFDHEGRPVAFDTWHDDLQLYLLSDIKDSVLQFDHVSGVAPTPPATADAQDSTGPVRCCRCSLLLPATAALGQLLLPYLFPELSAFATVADLVTHLRTSDARYRATVPAEFLPTNQPPMFITLYFIVSCLPDSLRWVLPLPPSPSFASAATAGIFVTEDVSAASTSAKRRSSKEKGGRDGGGDSVGGEGGSGSGGGGSGGGGGGSRGGGGGGTGGSSGGSDGGGGGSRGSGGSGGGGSGGGWSGPWRVGPGTCGKFHTEHHCFSRLDDAWRAEFGDDVERPRWTDLLKSGVAIFDLDYDAILSAMYALSFSAEGDCYWCVPPDPGIAAAALGASASGTPPSTTPAEALHTFTLDSGASHCFFCDSTTLTPLLAPVPVRLVDPSWGPIVACSSTVLPCPAVPSGSLSGLHLPLFSTILVSTAALQDAMVTTTTPGGSSLYTLATEPPQVAAFAQVSLPPLPPSPAPPYLPCIEGRQCAAPHSSLFPLTTAPLQTFHMDVWGSAHVSGQGRERYFLLVVDDYTRYTTVFPLRSKGEVPDVLIPWIRTVRLQLRERFGTDLPVLRLHSDSGGEFSFDLLRDFCRGEGILQSFTLPDSPQQNGIAECRIGLVMEVAHTSMIHVAAPHFLWPFAVRYAAHQLNLWPRISLPETSPTLRWTGKVGDGPVFWVWGSRAFVRDTSTNMLSARAIPRVFLGFVLDAPGWQFYHPTSRHVLPSQDVTFDGSFPFYPVGSGAARGATSGGAASGGAESEGAETGGAEPGGVETRGAEPRGAEPEGVEPGGAESEGAESGGAEPRGAASPGGPAGASPRISSQQLREWLVRHAHRRSGALGARGARDTRAGGAAVPAGAGGTGGAAATSPRGARTSEPGAAGAGGAGARGAGVGGCVGGTGAAGVAGSYGCQVGILERDYELHSLDFSTAFLQCSLHEEMWLRRPPGFIGTFPAGTQWSLRQPVYGLRQATREWHDTLRTTLAALAFAPSTADPSLFLRTNTLQPPFYVLVYVLQRFGFQLSLPQPTPLSTSHSLSAPPSDESVEPSGPYPELVDCLMYLMTCTRPDLTYPLSLLARYVAPGRHRKVHWDATKRVLHYLCSTSGMGLVLGGRGPVVLTGHADASWVDDSATQRSSQGYTFSLGSGSVSWRSTRSSSILSSCCEAEIYAGAMAAQELCWLTYLLTDLGEQPGLPLVLYVDNKAMIALCQEHRLEHQTQHIALRDFLTRELQQRGQLRLAYVATRANIAGVLTKALPLGDHQRFAAVLGL